MLNIVINISDRNNSKMNMNRFYSFVPSVSDKSGNFVKQSYEYLKTLEEYSSATDVLEEGQVI